MLTRMSGISRMRDFFTIVDLRDPAKRCCHLSTRSSGRRSVRLCRASPLYIFSHGGCRLRFAFSLFVRETSGIDFSAKSLSRCLIAMRFIRCPRSDITFRINLKNGAASFKHRIFRYCKNKCFTRV